MSAAGAIEVQFKGRLGAFELDVAFSTPARGVTGLFGPSGCGKTTALRFVAGLQRFEEGLCVVDGETWQSQASFVPAHKRAVGYVFQEASLFPHLSVRGNLMFGAARRPKGGVSFDDAVSLLGLAPLLDRRPHKLSGGERQRVAIGRALMSNPKLLLMDEPISALDAQTKEDILPFLERLHQSLALPMLYVTHDIIEIERLADQVVFMKAGRVVEADGVGGPSRASVSLEAEVITYDPAYGIARLAIDGGTLIAPATEATVGERRRVRIFAADVSIACIAPTRTSIANILPAVVLQAEAANESELVVLLGLGEEGNGARLKARITRYSWDGLRLKAGSEVFAQIKTVTLGAEARAD